MQICKRNKLSVKSLRKNLSNNILFPVNRFMHFTRWTIILIVFLLGFTTIQANFQKENSIFTEYFLSKVSNQINDTIKKQEIIESTQSEIRELTTENTLKQVFIANLKSKIEIIPNQSEQKVYRIQVSDLQKIDNPEDFFKEYKILLKKIEKDIAKYEKESFDFKEKQKIILENLEKEVSYIVQENFKKYIEQEIDLLRKTTSQKEFFTKIDEIYSDLDQYFNYIETPEDEFTIEIDKYFVVKNLQKEIVELSQDSFRKRMEIAQNSLDFTKDTFFDDVEDIYTEINNFYSSNNQTIPGGLKYERTEKSIQSDVLKKLEKEVQNVELKSAKKKLHEMLSEIDISDMDNFIEKTMTVYDALDSYYSDLEEYGLDELRYKESVKFIAPEPELIPVESSSESWTWSTWSGNIEPQLSDADRDENDNEVEETLNDILNKEIDSKEKPSKELNEEINDDNETISEETISEIWWENPTATWAIDTEETNPTIEQPQKWYDQYTPEATPQNPFVETMKDSQNNNLDTINNWNEDTN